MLFFFEAFAPQSLIAPIRAFTLIANILFAHYFLGEDLFPTDVAGNPNKQNMGLHEKDKQIPFFLICAGKNNAKLFVEIVFTHLVSQKKKKGKNRNCTSFGFPAPVFLAFV